MSKHLSPRDVARIVEVIQAMKAPVTWERIEKAIKRKLDLERSRWGLRENVEIKAAYDVRKKSLESESTASPPACSQEAKLSQIIARLDKDNHRLREQLALVLGNAIEMGVPLERMKRPPTVVSYGATPQRK